MDGRTPLKAAESLKKVPEEALPGFSKMTTQKISPKSLLPLEENAENGKRVKLMKQ